MFRQSERYSVFLLGIRTVASLCHALRCTLCSTHASLATNIDFLIVKFTTLRTSLLCTFPLQIPVIGLQESSTPSAIPYLEILDYITTFSFNKTT